jgi:hypothetical protein
VNRPAEVSRFEAALAMAELGVRLMRQSLRRRDPDASEAEIDAQLRRWLRSRPPDAEGRVQLLPSR